MFSPPLLLSLRDERMRRECLRIHSQHAQSACEQTSEQATPCQLERDSHVVSVCRSPVTIPTSSAWGQLVGGQGLVVGARVEYGTMLS